MIDKDTYKRELIRMWDSLRINKYKGRNNCNGVDCKKCPLHGFKYGCSNALSSLEIYCAVEKWSREHPQKQFKVSIAEFELLKIFKSYDHGVCHKFSTYEAMMKLLRNGCFAGATPDMTIDYYFKNCEVEEDV